MSHFTLRISLFILIFTSYKLTASEPALKCFRPGKMRHTTITNKKIEFDHDFCINHRQYNLISANCIENEKCKAISVYKQSKGLILPPSPIGSPAHRKCRALNGQPQFVDYFDGFKWIEASVCEFSDHSLISVFNTIE